MNGWLLGISLRRGPILQERSRSEEASWMVKSPGFGDFWGQKGKVISKP
jgi:hypothetical protein